MSDQEVYPGAGRNEAGYFAKGNQLAKGSQGGGNPNMKRLRELRKVFSDCVSDQDMREAYHQLMVAVRSGDMTAVREFFDRTMGKSPQAIAIQDADGESVPLSLGQITQALLAAIGDTPDGMISVADARLNMALAIRRVASGGTGNNGNRGEATQLEDRPASADA